MPGLIDLAQVAFNEGRIDDALDRLTEAVDGNAARNVEVYRALVTHLYRRDRFAEGEAYSRQAVARYPQDFDLWNLRGVMLRRLDRPADALSALDTALAIRPDDSAAFNRANVLLDLGEAGAAVEGFADLLTRSPASPEILRQLGRAELKTTALESAEAHLREAVRLRPAYVEAWIDLIAHLGDMGRFQEAEALCDQALRSSPDAGRLLEAKTAMIDSSGHRSRAEAFLRELLPRHPDAAWLHNQLGRVLGDRDRATANIHLRRAVEIEPDDPSYAMALVDSLTRTRGAGEGAFLEEAYHLARRAMGGHARKPLQTQAAHDLFQRLCAYDDLEALGPIGELGRSWAETDRHTALLMLLARVESREDRLELMANHRRAGERMAARAAARPIRRPPPRAVGAKIRLGLMSSDLRMHPVGSFALPLFEHLDRGRFELFAYSFYQGREDSRQTAMAAQATGYRWWRDITAGEAAQAIADDDLDMLIELGGSTAMNRLEVMAWRPAPRQASWLGYPHSAGLEAIDHFVCDPLNAPTDPALLAERPMVLPRTWLAFAPDIFAEAAIEPGLPQDRAGHITFGTANNTYKYTRHALRAWARVVAAVPGSKFAFIRPEGGSETFRRNVTAEFAAEGVAADRLVFRATRGRHMPHYNEIDISLDAFPLTGGTTTTEALWMGVPVVTLVGEAFHERLSRSLLTNVGRADLCAADLDDFQRIAVELAADKARRLEIRQTMRDRILTGPLGQTEPFARDFYDLVWKTVRED